MTIKQKFEELLVSAKKLLDQAETEKKIDSGLVTFLKKAINKVEELTGSSDVGHDKDLKHSGVTLAGENNDKVEKGGNSDGNSSSN